LQEGLLMIAKERPEDPIKNLGLFLINYKKWWNFNNFILKGTNLW
jgi:hypothetical protein